MRHGLSRGALAIRGGTTESAIADIECGRTSPAIQELIELLHLVGEELILASEKRETGIDVTLNQGNLELGSDQRVQRGLAFADFVRQNRGGGAEALGRSLEPGPLLQALIGHEVDFVVVGSVAGLVHGSAYPTYDLDVAYARNLENLNRLACALADVGVEGDPGLSTGTTFSFDTPFGSLDVLGEIGGIRDYQELRRDSRCQSIAGIGVRVACLNHLIAMKRASVQRKDQLMAMEYVELADLHRREDGAT
jgi:transcriptional regulator with XRE-family HTH domain